MLKVVSFSYFAFFNFVVAAGDKTFTMKPNCTLSTFVFHYEFVTWHDARERCAGAGAQLWAPEDEAQARAVREELKFLDDVIWTGINDIDKLGDYRTLDGRPFEGTYDNWHKNQPDDSISDWRCAVLRNDSSMGVYYCKGLISYVCKLPATALPSQPGDTALPCDSPNQICNKTFTLETNCIDVKYEFHNEKVTWYEAKQRCVGAGAQLWVPGDEAEMKTVRNLVGGMTWTGIIFQGRSLETSFYHFYKLGLNESSRHCCCAALQPGSSLAVVKCDVLTDYVCKFLVTAPTSRRGNETSQHCDGRDKPCGLLHKTFAIRGVTYVYHPEGATWQQAKERCSAVGAELLVPEDEVEARTVRREVNRVLPDYHIWVGISNLQELLYYKTLDGRSLKDVFSDWAPNQPFPLDETKARCVALITTVLLYVIDCEDVVPYVCKYPAT